ncbi:DUF896 domain-containing protein [Mesoplasma photuris]|uniref:DUF896 domain-containing protein n=1 Tax=Mesoplasma photuris TaxID=217731 RepID=UPI0004E272FF
MSEKEYDTLDKIIPKINEYAKIKKERELTESEIKHRDILRQRYLEIYRAGFIDQLKSIKVVDEKGNDVTPEKLRKLKEEQH